MNFETKLVQTLLPDELTGALSLPIYQTSTFVQEAPGVNKGYDYSRSGNPTREALEELITTLEGGCTGAAFSSGLAAIDAVIKLLNTGDAVLAIDDVYGGTYRIFTEIYSRLGITINFVDTTDLNKLIDHITPKTKIIWLESPSNPTLKISDITEIAKIAHANNCLLIVDNTFASPALQRPLELGADIVVHSATKYLAGHSDVTAGLVVTQDRKIGEKIKYIQNATGGVLAPFDAWLTVRGMQTLSLRIEKQSCNALKIAEYLNERNEVENVYYPGLPSHPNHLLAKKQQRLFGGIISFTLKENTFDAAKRLIASTGIFKLAASLGGVKSLICHPASMTHASVPEERKRQVGVEDSLIRLSVGIEHESDLINDLDRSFNTYARSVLVT